MKKSDTKHPREHSMLFDFPDEKAADRARSRAKAGGHTAEPYVPEHTGLSEMTKAVQRCRGCDLYKDATQAVFGEGSRTARVVLVGEQPGDKEDREGRPFVGPAGRILDQALMEAGIHRDEVYVTNAVKHFRFIQTAHYRQHRNPSGLQIHACRPWLEAEIDTLRPDAIVCMGTVAAESVLQKKVTIKERRGHLSHHPLGAEVMVTIHPSSLLRLRGLPDGQEMMKNEYAKFVQDLKQVGRYLARHEPPLHARKLRDSF